IRPEGCAAILWNDRSRATEAAEALKVTATHAVEFQLVDDVLSEPLGGAHHGPAATAATLKTAIARNLAALGKLSPDELVQARYEKFRGMGCWEEPTLQAPTAAEPEPKPARKPR